MILTRIHIAVLLLLAAVLWLLFLLTYGTVTWPLDFPALWSYFKPFGTVVGALVLILLIFDKWAWRWPIFKGWLVRRPDIRGTWLMKLSSNWIDPDTGNRIPTKSGFVSVSQTYSRLNIRVMTEESTSDSLATQLVERPDGSFELAAVYLNIPKAEFRHRSEMHHGGMLLILEGDPTERIEGNYWTSRASTGDMVLSERRPEILTAYQSAVDNRAESHE